MTIQEKYDSLNTEQCVKLLDSILSEMVWRMKTTDFGESLFEDGAFKEGTGFKVEGKENNGKSGGWRFVSVSSNPEKALRIAVGKFHRSGWITEEAIISA